MSYFGTALVSLALLSSPPVAQDLGEPPFHPLRYPAVDGFNRSFATGDLDGDGDVDLALCRGSDLNLLWNSGAGWIERREILPVPCETAAAGDLDGDGDCDLVTIHSDEASVLLADGQGGFAPPTQVPLGEDAADLLLGDVDSDGHLDVVGVCATSIRVLLGDGHGAFVARISTGIASATIWFPPSSAALGDLDEDGNPDLVVEPGELLLFGDGKGGFIAGGRLGVQFSHGRSVLADLDRDGHLDLLTGTGGTLFVWLGDGQGGFSLLLSAWFQGRDLAVGDLDHDGDVDLVCKTTYGRDLGVWLNDGAGHLTERRKRIHFVGATMNNHELALADLDGNGDLDVLSADAYEVMFLPGDGAGWFSLPEDLPGAFAPYIEVADVDGDGSLDLVGSSFDVTTWLYGVTTWLGDGHGGFGSGMTTAYGKLGPLVVGDLDGDSHLDLATSDDSSALVFLGDGTGAFPHVRAYLVGKLPHNPSIADLNGDTWPDVVLATDEPWGIGVLTGDGQGSFTESWIPTEARFHDTAVGDADGDGDVDILAVGDGLYVFPLDGQGGIAAPIHYARPWDMLNIAFADLDHDGRGDVVVGPWFHGVWILWGSADGYAAPERIPGEDVLEHARDFALADVDGDGNAELLVAFEGFNEQNTPGGLAVLRWTGARDYVPMWICGPAAGSGWGGSTTTNGPWTVAVGDLDRNGRLDAVVGSMMVSYGYSAPPSGFSGWPGGAGPVWILMNQLPPEAACTGEISYCVAKLNSAGCLPRICSDGSPTLSGPDDFVVRAERVVSHCPGILFWGLAPAGLPFQGGTLCVQPPLARTAVQDSGGTPGADDCSGTYSFPFSDAYMASQGLAAGTPLYAQYWSRDPKQLPPDSSGLTDALSIAIVP